MSTIFEIPLSTGQPQSIAVTLGGVQYRLTFKYINCDQGGWLMDIVLANGTPKVLGIPLVTGVDLLAQYKYMNFGGGLRVQTVNTNVPRTIGTTSTGDQYQIIVTPDTVPTFANFGGDSKIFWVTP